MLTVTLMQKSVRISGISADILNLFSIQTHTRTPSVVRRDNTHKKIQQRENIRQNGERVLLNFSGRWPHSFFMHLRCWNSISRQFSVAQVKFPKVKQKYYSYGLWQKRLTASKTVSWLPCFDLLRRLQQRLPTVAFTINKEWLNTDIPGMWLHFSLFFFFHFDFIIHFHWQTNLHERQCDKYKDMATAQTSQASGWLGL